MKPSFIYINGYPGVGKLKVAKALQQLIPGSKIYTYHDFNDAFILNVLDKIDPVAGQVDYANLTHDASRAADRRRMLEEIARSEETRDNTIIFTDCRCKGPVGTVAAQDFYYASKIAAVPFFSVILTCDKVENIKRIGDRQRGTGPSCTRLGDPDLLMMILREDKIYQFGLQWQELELDVTRHSPQEAALIILRHVERHVEREYAWARTMRLKEDEINWGAWSYDDY